MTNEQETKLRKEFEQWRMACGDIESLRPEFEQWIKSLPCGLGKTKMFFPWNGQYAFIEVQLAWEAWQEAATWMGARKEVKSST